MKVYAVIDEYYDYDYSTDSDFNMELFGTLEDAEMYFEVKKEECFEHYLDRYGVDSTEELINDCFEEYDEDVNYMRYEIYDDCSECIYIKEYDIMSFK